MSDETPPVIVRGHRYKVRGAQTEAFHRSLDAIILSHQKQRREAYAHRDDFIEAMPLWAVGDLIEAAEELATRARQLRPDAYDHEPPVLGEA